MKLPRPTQILLLLCVFVVATANVRAQSAPSATPAPSQNPSLTLQPPFDRLELLAYFAAPWDTPYELEQARARGIDFIPDRNFQEALGKLRLSSESIDKIKSIKPKPAAKPSPTRDQAYHLVLSAVQNLAAGQHGDAAEKYEQALLLAPDSATLHLAYSGDLMLLHRERDAEEQARLSLKLWPEDAEAHTALAVALISQLKETEAAAQAREALRLYPRHKAALIMLSMALTRDGKFEEAIPVLREAISHTPEFPAIHKDLGVCLVHTGKNAGAVAELTGYLANNSDDADAHYYLGVALRAQGLHDDAILQFREAVRLAPEDPLAAAAANDDAPSPASDSSSSPQADDGSVSGNIYTNRFFGFSIEFPQGWTVLSQQQSRDILSAGSAIVQSADPTVRDVMYVSHRMMTPLLFVMRGSSRGQPLRTDILEVFVVDERAEKTPVSAMQLAARMDAIFRSLGALMQTIAAPESIEIAGRDFAKIESIYPVNNDAMHLTNYATVAKGFILTFQMIAADPDDLKKLESTIQSLRFTDSPN
jgi:tetratricopeptide (TPR) repeat protein